MAHGRVGTKSGTTRDGRPHGMVDPWFAAGAALYWVSVALRYLDDNSLFTPFLDGTLLAVFKYTLLVIFLVAGYAMMRHLSLRRSRIVLALTVIVVSLALFVIDLVAPELIVSSAPLVGALDFTTIGAFMLLWGMAFASMDKVRAAQNVVVVALATAALLLVCIALAGFVPLRRLTYPCAMLSGAIMLGSHIHLTNTERPRARGQRTTAATAVLQRVGFGVLLGFCSLACTFAMRDGMPLEPAAALLVLGLLTVGCALGMYLHASSQLYTMLPALFMVAVGAAGIAWLGEGMLGMLRASTVTAWIAWSSLSAVQLSDLKETLGMSELALCAIDKISLAASFVMGSALFGALDAAVPLERHAGELSVVVFAAILLATLGVAYVIASLVSDRKEDEVRSELRRSDRERTEQLYDAIAREFGLSTREREVMAMLAEGYTSVYIKDVLDMSHGTAKAHIAHIYQKTGIHRKDDLLDLIDARRSAM